MTGAEVRSRPGSSVESGLDTTALAQDVRLYARYLVGTPVLWLAGVLTLAGLVLVVRLAWLRWPKGSLINVIASAWIAIGVMQAIASLANGLLIGDVMLGLHSAVGMSVFGWISAGLAIAVGSACQLTDIRVVRATALLGVWILVFGAVSGLGVLMGFSHFTFQTPTSLAFPNLDIAQYYGSAQFFISEDSFGEVRTRLILFFPWATALGMGGTAIVLISLREPHWHWRLLGFTGGMIGVIFSWSRMALIAVAVALAADAFLRLSGLWRFALIGLTSVALYGAMATGLNPMEIVSEFEQFIVDARSGSSLAREIIYEKSWEGFLESPVIGQGWIGESVHPIEHLPIGSHSTVYGLLYTGGLPTFLVFATALVLTIGSIIAGLIVRTADRKASADLRTALELCIVLAICAPYESLFSSTLPCLFLFTWIGGALWEVQA